MDNTKRYMGPSVFPGPGRPMCRRTADCSAKLLAFVVFAVAVGASFSVSPGYGAAEGFDLITSSGMAVSAYEFMLENPANVQQITGMVILPFYILLVVFVAISFLKDDMWLIITAVFGWMGSLVICLCIGIPVDQRRIRYWETGTFPLEYLLSDNTVNTHLVISFICSHSIVAVLGARTFAKVMIVCYNILLTLFTVVTRCSNPQAAMSALLVGIVAIYSNRAFNDKWVQCQREMTIGKRSRCCFCLPCCYFSHRESADHVDFGTSDASPGDALLAPTLVEFRSDQVQHQPFSSLLARTVSDQRLTRSVAFRVQDDEDQNREVKRAKSFAEEEEEERQAQSDFSGRGLTQPWRTQHTEESNEDTKIQSSSICTVAATNGEVELESIHSESDEDVSPHTRLQHRDASADINHSNVDDERPE